MGLLISANSYATTVSNIKFDFRVDEPNFSTLALSYFDSSGEYVLDVWAREAITPMPTEMMLQEQSIHTINIRPRQLLMGIGAAGGQFNELTDRPWLLGPFELLNFRLTDLDATNGFFGGNALSLMSDIKLKSSAGPMMYGPMYLALYEDPSIGNLPPRDAPLIDTEIYEMGLNYLESASLLMPAGDVWFLENGENHHQGVLEMAASYGSLTFAISMLDAFGPESIGIESLEFGLVPVGNEVPIPAAAWLFGSALAGLIAVRRRK